MSVVQPDQENRQSSPGLTLNLASNNPFRNRAASPLLSPERTTSPHNPPPRPVSRNPFLDASAFPQPPATSPDKMSFPADSKPALTGNAAELFDELTLNDKPRSSGMRPPPPRSKTTTDRVPSHVHSSSTGRSENVPPRGPSGHGPSRSQEEAMRARRQAASGSGSKSRPTGELDIFADPFESPKKGERRTRRNSESSVMERNGKSLSPEEEKKRDERRRRERRRREEKDGKPKKPDRKLDIIDQLDATSIYGTGLFHHDGPFDACNPHRNRKGSRRAPMQAFPKDSLNNVLGGGGPLNKRPDHATFLGNNDEEAFKDYSKGGVGYNGYESYAEDERPDAHRQNSNIMSATTRIEPIHGDETLGLGTSTFLEGAPASRTAIQRRTSEQNSPPEGLSRKKSLAQKIRGINNGRREYGPSGRITGPDGAVVSPDALPVYTPGGSNIPESNPFFNEFSKGDDSRKESITIVEPEKSGRPRAPSSPKRGYGLERRNTSEGGSGELQHPKTGNGFLSRVKSLKGGPKKPKPERTPLPQESYLLTDTEYEV